MTAFFIDLTKPQRAFVSCDTLAYTLTGDRNEPLGYARKVQPLQHVPAAWFGSGLFDIQVRAYAELLLRPELTTHAAVVDALPGILRDATADVAAQRAIPDPDGLLLFVGLWCGYDHAAGRCELVMFENTKNYEPQRGFTGLIGLPNVSAEYLPRDFLKLPAEARAAAAIRCSQKFIADHGEAMGQPQIGGAIMVTEVGRHGVATREVAKFSDYRETEARIAATQARLAVGATGGGVDLVHRVADRDAAAERVRASLRASRAA